ncbi:SpoIIE family protein phosphatase [Streptomyces sp. NPDC004546]|uniref:ATP-binding SpoIIE family protein phosphatase n=1 Tax=Streptomyces sp. NPDC004546 TaxID=3154282 RepID=UPI0033B11DEC
MDFTADSLLSRAAQVLGAKAGALVQEVEDAVRRDVPELWEDPDVMASENIAEHVATVLFALEHGPDRSLLEPPDADAEHARRLARHGKPVTAMLRAFRLGQGVVVARLLEEMPRLTSDPELISAAAGKLIGIATEYVDRTSERGVIAFQEERDRRLRWRMSVVNEASTRIGTTLDIARTLQELADLATEQFADLVTVDLLDSVLHEPGTPAGGGPRALRRIAQKSAAGDSPEPTTEPRQLITYLLGSPPDRALTTGRSARYDTEASPLTGLIGLTGLTGESPTPAEPGLAAGARRIHSTLVIPLRARGTTLGVAQFFRHQGTKPFDDADLLFVQDIVARTAVAVDHALRYTQMRAAALALQRSLLPQRAPGHSSVEIARRYVPADAELGVGGDWYDVIPLSGARVALVVGDVVGHGIQAAATMGRLRTAVRTLADIDLPPDELLTHLDDVVIRLSAETTATPDGQGTDPAEEGGGSARAGEGPAGGGGGLAGDGEGSSGGGDGDIGATCLYAVYDPVCRRCTLARAGHVLPAMVSRDGAVDILDLPPGPPLGLGGLPFEAAEVDLPDGSLLALYTDGLLAAHDHDVEAGLAKLRHVLARTSVSLEATCDTVLDALLPVRPDDDVALLLARTNGLGDRQVITWELEADPAAVSRARSSVSEQLTAWGLDELGFTAELVVSELVTNALRYGQPPIRLRLINDSTLLCEVSDDSNTTPHLRRARVFDEGGRGLLLVAQIARRWGTRQARRGKTVWAELDDGAGLSTPASF